MSIDGKKLWAKLIVDKCIFSLDYRTPTEEYEEKAVSKCINLLKWKWTNLLYAELRILFELIVKKIKNVNIRFPQEGIIFWMGL